MSDELTPLDINSLFPPAPAGDDTTPPKPLDIDSLFKGITPSAGSRKAPPKVYAARDRVRKDHNLDIPDDVVEDFNRAMGHESGHKHTDSGGSTLTSFKGAKGYSQIMPDTLAKWGKNLDPNNEDDNIYGGLAEFYSNDPKDPIARRIAYVGGPGSSALDLYRRTGVVSTSRLYPNTASKETFYDYVNSTGGFTAATHNRAHALKYANDPDVRRALAKPLDVNSLFPATAAAPSGDSLKPLDIGSLFNKEQPSFVPRETSPAKESKFTISEQVKSALDPSQTERIGVLLTDPSQLNDISDEDKGRFTTVATAKGTLLVNTAQAAKRGLKTPQAIFKDVDDHGVESYAGIKESVPDTSKGLAVKHEDVHGNELASAVVTSPEGAAKQAASYGKQFPQGKSKVAPAQQVVAERQAEVAKEDVSTDFKGLDIEVPLMPDAANRKDYVRKTAASRVAEMLHVPVRDMQLFFANKPFTHPQDKSGVAEEELTAGHKISIGPDVIESAFEFSQGRKAQRQQRMSTLLAQDKLKDPRYLDDIEQDDIQDFINDPTASESAQATRELYFNSRQKHVDDGKSDNQADILAQRDTGQLTPEEADSRLQKEDDQIRSIIAESRKPAQEITGITPGPADTTGRGLMEGYNWLTGRDGRAVTDEDIAQYRKDHPYANVRAAQADADYYVQNYGKYGGAAIGALRGEEGAYQSAAAGLLSLSSSVPGLGLAPVLDSIKQLTGQDFLKEIRSQADYSNMLASFSRAGDDSVVMDIYQAGIRLPMAAGRFFLISKIPGLSGSAATFGFDNALQAIGRGDPTTKALIESGGPGALMGRVLHGASEFGNTFESSIGKVAASTAAVGAGVYGLEMGLGAKHDDAVRNTVTMIGLHLVNTVPGLAGKPVKFVQDGQEDTVKLSPEGVPEPTDEKALGVIDLTNVPKEDIDRASDPNVKSATTQAEVSEDNPIELRPLADHKLEEVPARLQNISDAIGPEHPDLIEEVHRDHLPQVEQEVEAEHRTAVRDSLLRGEDVPEEVLKDYPDIKVEANDEKIVDKILAGGHEELGMDPERAAEKLLDWAGDKAKEAAGRGGTDDVKVRPLPRMEDNYVKPLATYTHTLYRETDIDGTQRLLLEGSADRGREVFLSNTPELALGQGKNKGILLELDAGDLQGQVNTAKPGWEFAYRNGATEFIGKYNKSYGDKIKSVTFSPETLKQRTAQSLMKNLDDLGFIEIRQSDGSVRFERGELINADQTAQHGEPVEDVAPDRGQETSIGPVPEEPLPTKGGTVSGDEGADRAQQDTAAVPEGGRGAEVEAEDIQPGDTVYLRDGREVNVVDIKDGKAVLLDQDGETIQGVPVKTLKLDPNQAGFISTDLLTAVPRALLAARDWVSMEPVRKMKELGVDMAAKIHAAARVSTPHVVNDILARVFPDQYKDPAAMSRTIDILNKDDILGGYHTFLVNAQAAQNAGDLQAAHDWQTKAQAIGTPQEMADLEREVRAADPEVIANIDRWSNIVNPQLDILYNRMKGVNPNTPRDPRGYVYEARINLLPEVKAEAMRNYASNLADPAPEPSITNYRNPAAKKDSYDRAARFTGNYSTDPVAVLTNVLGHRLNEVSKLDMYEDLVARGVAEMPDQGTPPPTDIGGKRAVYFPIEIPQTNNEGYTRMVKQPFYVREDIARELRDVLKTDMKVQSNPVAQFVTSLQVVQLADLAAHLKNIHTVLASAPATASAFKDAVRKTPGVGTVDSLARISGVIKELHDDGPAIRSELAEMAKNGMVRPQYRSTGIQRITKGQEIIHTVDTASRVVMNRFFQNMVDAGRVADTPENRNSFVQQIGEYNDRLMSPMMRFFKQSGLAPFVVAGRTFNRQGRRLITGNPGVEASSTKEAIKMRAVNLTALTAALALPAILNYSSTGKMQGRPGTPIGAWDLGQDEDEKGKHKVVDILQILGIRRGLRSTGVNAVMTGLQEEQSWDDIAGAALKDIVTTAAHPWMGPSQGAAYQTLTGQRLDLRGGPAPAEARQMEGGLSQYGENARVALKNTNPALYELASPAIGTEEENSETGYGYRILGGLFKSPTQAVGVTDVKSPAAKLMDKFKVRIQASRTPEENKRTYNKNILLDQFRSKKIDLDTLKKTASNLVGKGELTEDDLTDLVTSTQLDKFQTDFKKLSFDGTGTSPAEKVYKAATDDEKKRLAPVMLEKQAGLLKEQATDQAKAQTRTGMEALDEGDKALAAQKLGTAPANARKQAVTDRLLTDSDAHFGGKSGVEKLYIFKNSSVEAQARMAPYLLMAISRKPATAAEAATTREMSAVLTEYSKSLGELKKSDPAKAADLSRQYAQVLQVLLMNSKEKLGTAFARP